MNNPKISVVVPVYNVEKYLRKCLDSIINQTFRDFELICINDGSPDNSLEILREYEKKDDRVIVIDQKNTGVSTARNNAIDIAKGEYIIFFDSDDWVDLDTLEVIYSEINSENADVVIFSYVREYENRSLKKNIFPKEKIFFDESGCKKLHRLQVGIYGDELRKPENADSICSPCTNLYKLSIIKEQKIKFVDLKEIGTFEDGLFNIEYFGYIKKAVYINKHFYHYRKTNPNSQITCYNKDLPIKWDNLFNIIERYIEGSNLSDEYSGALKNRIALSITGMGLNVVCSDLTFTKKINEIKSILKKPKIKSAIKSLPLKFMPIHWKIFFFCCKTRCYYFVYILLNSMNNLRKKV